MVPRGGFQGGEVELPRAGKLGVPRAGMLVNSSKSEVPRAGMLDIPMVVPRGGFQGGDVGGSPGGEPWWGCNFPGWGTRVGM